ENFLGLVQLAVAADQEDVWVASGSVAASLDIDALALTKLGRLVATTPDVCREGEFALDYAEWTFLPSYNVHFFRRVHTIDDFLVVQNSLLPRAAGEGTTTTSPGTAGTAFKVEEGAALPDGIVTFLMTDVVESTPLWLASRGSMYQTMRRHDQLLVSETTYSIVADILRSDIQLVSVGKRRLEGHDRQEEVYVVQNPEVELEAGVAGDDVEAAVS